MFHGEEVMRYANRIKSKAAVTRYLAHARIWALEYFPYADRRMEETVVSAGVLQDFDLAISKVNSPHPW